MQACLYENSCFFVIIWCQTVYLVCQQRILSQNNFVPFVRKSAHTFGSYIADKIHKSEYVLLLYSEATIHTLKHYMNIHADGNFCTEIYESKTCKTGKKRMLSKSTWSYIIIVKNKLLYE